MNKHIYNVKFSTNFQENNIVTLLSRPKNSSATEVELTWGLEATLYLSTKEYLSIYLHLLNSNEQDVWAKFKFSISNEKGLKIESLKNDLPYKFTKKDADCWGVEKFARTDFLLDDKNNFIVDNKFTVQCVISYLSPELSPGLLGIIKYQEPESRLKNDYLSMIENNKFSDVTLTVCEKEFKAHKAVLAARSPVFSAMFEHEMKENKLNQVNIPDIDPEVFEEMLRFIYTDESPNLNTMAEDLLAAADKYQLERLKIMSSMALCKNITIDNAAKILVLTDIYNIEEFKNHVLHFISTRAKDVMETEGFGLITKSYPHLLENICRVLAMKIEC